ncbi:MAG TPA: HNH endonuclease [Chloroflexia bacterium]|nr:HNH endonuclease [Chloroflexia bacterium]
MWSFTRAGCGGAAGSRSLVPVSRGGTNDPHNLQTLCRECNQGKRDQL